MSDSSFEREPLIDAALAGEFYCPTDDAEITGMQRSIWTNLSGDILRDLSDLEAMDLPAMKEALHRIRGYTSNLAFNRLGRLLQAWENDVDPPAASGHFLPLARATATESIGFIEARYPHLPAGADPPGPMNSAGDSHGLP